MTDTKTRIVAVLATIAATTVLSAFIVGCAPKTVEPGSQSPGDEPIAWMEADCALCHEEQSDTAVNGKTGFAKVHSEQNMTCTECHNNLDDLNKSHDGVTMESKKPKKLDHDMSQSCIDCHGTLEEMAAITSESETLVDKNGTTANPHDIPDTPSHETPSCTECHGEHEEKDALEDYCFSCHHAQVFECNTCHE